MASTVLDPTATKIQAILTGLSVTPTIKGYVWAPADLDSMPAGVVDMPSIHRIIPDEAESQLGTTDWHLEYPVTLYFDMSEAVFSQGQAVEYVEAFIKAIDADPTLSATVLDAKVVEAEPHIVVTDARPLIAYETRVEVLQLV